MGQPLGVRMSAGSIYFEEVQLGESFSFRRGLPGAAGFSFLGDAIMNVFSPIDLI